MNIIKNSMSQIGRLRAFLPRLVINEASYCTAVDNASLVNVNSAELPVSEPDKLYKRVELEIRSNEPAVLKSYSWFAKTSAEHLGIEIGENKTQRIAHKERYTLLKSVHVHKKHRVQYEIRTHFHFLHLHRITGSTCDTLLEYIERNLPEGVAMKVTKIEMQRLPEYFSSHPITNKEN